MKRSRYFLLGILLQLFFLPVHGQVKDSEVLFTVGGDAVTAGEFKRMYLKNLDQTGGTKQSPEEYLDLYINFKLKVHEARVLGYDTMPDYRQELAHYREQLAEPYIVSPEVMDSLIREGYDHLKKELYASHILVRLGASEDATEAWNKIMEIRRKILVGASFEEMARAVSDDPSAKNNGGHIGYFTAFQMVYPFEEAAYALKAGELSQPVRTRFGYHLIRVDTIKPNPGEIHVAHIMIAVPRNASQQMREAARDTVYMIWKELQEGADFSAMAKKYSKDYSSARTGGVLPWFGPGRMIPSFANAAFALKKNGDISRPVETPYGWHIIKRLDSKPVGSFEEMKAEIRKKVNRSDRLRYVQDKQLNSLMKKYHAVADTALLGVFAAEAKLEQHKITWAYHREIADRTIFSFRDQKVPFRDFYDYIHKKYIRNDLSADAFIRDSFNKYTRQKVLNYRKAHLEEEYPEFAAIIKEYSEGMLMFNIMDDKVWSKAVKDSAALEKFYREHQDRYMTPGKTIVERITLNNPSLLKKVMKEVKKAIKKDIPLTDVVAKYNKGGKKVLAFSQDTLVPGKGEEPEWQGWKKGSVHVVDKPQKAVWYVSGKIPPVVKPLKEQLGVVTSDYQDYLEKQWLEELKKKYPVEVNREVFNRLKKELEKESGGGDRQGA